MSYEATGIFYTRINANNTEIATSNLGAIPGQSATNVISGPVHGTGSFSSYNSGTLVVTGNATTFESDGYVAGQYLYYFDATSDNPILYGQIDSVDSETLLTLTAAGTVSTATAGDRLGVSDTLITTEEAVYIAVPTGSFPPNEIYIPNFTFWRQGGSTSTAASLNNTTITKLDRYSNAQVPLSIAAPAVNVDFTIQIMNQFSGNSTATSYWASTDLLPQYIWAKLIPTNTTTGTLLTQTLYRFATQEVLDSIIVGINTSDTTLRAAGYPV